MKTVIKYLKEFRGKMILGLVIKIIGSVAELMLPYILSHILANALGRSVGDILFWGILMLACSGVACVFNIVANRMAAEVSSNFARNMRKDLFIKTLKLSARQTDKFTIPSLESRITSDTYNVHHFVNMMQRMGIRAPIMLTGGIIMTLLMDAHLSLVMIAMSPFIFVTVYFISKKGVPLYTKVQRSVDSMVRVVREDSQGIRVIKALSKTDYEHRRYDEVNSALVKDETRAGVIMSSVHPIMMALMNMGTVAVIAIGALRVSKGLSKPETIIAFMQYFTHISMSLMVVTRIFVMYTKSAASASRIEEVLLSGEDISVYEKTVYPDKKSDEHIEFCNVTFSYKGKRKNLKDINFKLKKGDSLGIIGATGSGKSTVIKLLLRFYDTDEGAIYINGEDIRTIPKEQFYKMFGSALQYDFLFADTIEENICLGRDIPHQDVVAAAKTAQASEFIESFEDGYSHMLSQHAGNLS
ncbi:MAG: ABC transporter ATP-binding protein, partial [Clostridia bacterium]|nr:ABC transporter ATP-binding protein [Clostridia bacterium]